MITESKITNKTKAIICVHMLGKGGPVQELKALSKKYKIPVIEDACEAVGGMQGLNILELYLI